MNRIDKHNPMVSKKEVIDLCDMLLSQGRGKKKSLAYIKSMMGYVEEKENDKKS